MSEKINNKKIGQRIKLIRINKGLNKTEFGREFGANGSLVHKWESTNVIPSANRIAKIAEFGNITVDELLYGNSITIKELKNFLASIEGSKLADDIDNFTLQEVNNIVKGMKKNNEKRD